MATPWQPSPKKLRDEVVVFAVGDIHGYVEQLRELRAFIQSEIDENPDYQYKIVYLGDYIDRGPHS
ncbi:MAG: hypothetical protein FIA97_00110 [Methylococcaceae bacterium]|nr:hypothetical protein [Methylococcaceae bacterium]